MNMFFVGNQMEYITLSLGSIKPSGYKMGLKFGKDPLVVEQNNCLTKLVNVYIANNLTVMRWVFLI